MESQYVHKQPTAQETDVIQYEVADNGICTIWLNRPHKRNCVSPQLLRDLEVAVDRARGGQERAGGGVPRPRQHLLRRR